MWKDAGWNGIEKMFSFSQFSSPWSGEGEMAGTEAELLLKGLFFELGKYPLCTSKHKFALLHTLG